MKLSPMHAAVLGWSVIPVRADKRPCLSWQQYQEERADQGVISQWGDDFSPSAWAVITGAISGVVVLDFDGEAGLQTLKSLGLKPHVRTGSGGYHVYLQHPGFNVKTLNSKSVRMLGELYPGVDIRGDGGYAIFAGSTDKGSYEWLRDPVMDPVTVIPEEMWLHFGLMCACSENEAISLGAKIPPSERVPAELLLARAMEQSDNGRNNAGFWLACQLRDNDYGYEEANGVMARYQATAPAQNPRGEIESYTLEEAIASLREAYEVPACEPWGSVTIINNSNPGKTQKGGMEKGRKTSVSQAALLLSMTLDMIRFLFRTPEGDSYVILPVGAVVQTHSVASKAFRDIIRHEFFLRYGALPQSEALKNTIEQISAEASASGNIRQVHARLAQHDGAIYLDLADDEWRVVRIDSNGWKVITDPPVAFRRGAGMLPLPVPTKGGNLRDLRKYINVSEDQWVLLVSFLLGALQADAPFPVLMISGEQGSAKSTATRLIKDLIDPNSVPLRIRPKEDRDVIIAAANGWLIAYDNISSIPEWLSDVIAALATGTGYSTRELYSDHGEAILSAKRPLIMNGIGDLIERSDLLDRAILISLNPISEERRVPAKELWSRFNEDKPAILGALLDCIAAALKNLPNTRLSKLPRMADFALWVCAAEEVLPWASGTFMNAYTENRGSAHSIALEGNPVADRIIEFMKDKPDWMGKVSELYRLLKPDDWSERFPKSAAAMGSLLQRAIPNLRHIGIVVETRHTKNGTEVTIRYRQYDDSAGDGDSNPLICTPINRARNDSGDGALPYSDTLAVISKSIEINKNIKQNYTVGLEPSPLSPGVSEQDYEEF